LADKILSENGENMETPSYSPQEIMALEEIDLEFNIS
jgi:hypothetical protein